MDKATFRCHHKNTSSVVVGYIDEGNRGFTILLKHGSFLKTPFWYCGTVSPITHCLQWDTDRVLGGGGLFSQCYSVMDVNEILTISNCEVAI